MVQHDGNIIMRWSSSVTQKVAEVFVVEDQLGLRNGFEYFVPCAVISWSSTPLIVQSSCGGTAPTASGMAGDGSIEQVVV